MNTLFLAWLDRLRTSYWFIPALMAVGAIGLSFGTVHVDTLVQASWVRHHSWIWGGGPEGARSVLATVAGSTITVAGVVFSITIVALTLASSQFGPRLLRNFMDDRGTQTVLGVFVATFLYCLLVLRTIRGTDATTFIPFISVTCGIVFSVISLGFLIYFIHHVPSSILAENLIARVAGELQDKIASLYPEDAGDKPERALPELPVAFDAEAHRILARDSGYIQAVGLESLLELAEKRDLVVRLPRRPGSFVAAGSVLAEVWPRREAGAAVVEQIQSAFFLGPQRTPTQDVEYCVDQLVEVAVRALSPGINDPFTAISCIEWLGVGLIQLSRRRMPAPQRVGEDGRLHLVADTPTFAGVADAALNQIRQYGSSSVAVVLRLLEVIGRVGREVKHPRHLEVLLAHARKIHRDGIARTENPQDKAEIDERLTATEAILEPAA